MDDRISSLPDAILCHILSFLPTKQSVAASILSKRWKPLWRSVPALDFDDDDFRYDRSIIEDAAQDFDDDNFRYDGSTVEEDSRFVKGVCTFIISRNFHQPIHTFYIRHFCDYTDSAVVNAWLTAAEQSRVQYLELNLDHNTIDLFSPVFSCKTLVDLKLINLKVNALSSVDLPSLKILHLYSVQFSKRRQLTRFLTGTPNLEDLEIEYVVFDSYVTEGNFTRLPKLLRARIVDTRVPLDLVSNVQFLHIELIEDMFSQMDFEDIEDPIPEFQNLTHLEVESLDYAKSWYYLLEALDHCPKLHNLSIEKTVENGGLEEDWSCPPYVPACIALNLKTCRFPRYNGTGGELEFAKYIMKNARILPDMIIRVSINEDNHEMPINEDNHEMLKELALCTRLSSACKLIFD